MGLVEYAARELYSSLHKGSQEFYAFVMPAIDMYEDGNDLIVEIDLPGFAKEDISLRIIDSNILSIKAKRRPPQERLGPVHYTHRPIQIDKRIVLPVSTKEGESRRNGKVCQRSRHIENSNSKGNSCSHYLIVVLTQMGDTFSYTHR
jgi:HSP20 family protein